MASGRSRSRSRRPTSRIPTQERTTMTGASLTTKASRRPLSSAALAVTLLGLFAAPSRAGGPASGAASGPEDGPVASSYDQIQPVLLGKETFAERMSKDKHEKIAIMERQQKLLDERYDLSARVSDRVKMSRGKPVPVGP